MIFSYYLFIAGSHAMHAARLMLKIIGYSEGKKIPHLFILQRVQKFPQIFLIYSERGEVEEEEKEGEEEEEEKGGGGREGGGGEGGRGEGRG